MPAPIPSIPMGEIRVARHEGVLRTLLGSCIGISLWDRRTKIAALAHVVLPRCNMSTNGLASAPGKYADTAVPEMLRRMAELARGESISPSAKIAGGANMFTSPSSVSVGDQNIEAVEAILLQCKIPILGRHLRGEQGRRMLLDVATGGVTIEMVGAETILL